MLRGGTGGSDQRGDCVVSSVTCQHRGGIAACWVSGFYKMTPASTATRPRVGDALACPESDLSTISPMALSIHSIGPTTTDW